MTARHAHLTLVLALLAGPAWAQAAEPADVCKAVTVRQGDPIPDNACAVNIVPRTPGVEGIGFGSGPTWQPVDSQAMPGVFYDSESIAALSERPLVMRVTVAWFYAQPRVSEANGQPYGSVTQPVTLNCSNNTYTVTETQHYAGPNANGGLVESIPVAGIVNAPVARDPVQRKLREVVCPAGGKSARK
ncbi:surface-adhesin E family protein [Achromobacter sp. NCFB-sbj8-Ac1-l]|uniref:surface-adhesin E family protein n=1 Tax=unclassified Achromobacter TaxID=2626865 RepID=UPI004046D98A